MAVEAKSSHSFCHSTSGFTSRQPVLVGWWCRFPGGYIPGCHQTISHSALCPEVPQGNQSPKSREVCGGKACSQQEELGTAGLWHCQRYSRVITTVCKAWKGKEGVTHQLPSLQHHPALGQPDTVFWRPKLSHSARVPVAPTPCGVWGPLCALCPHRGLLHEGLPLPTGSDKCRADVGRVSCCLHSGLQTESWAGVKGVKASPE